MGNILFISSYDEDKQSSGINKKIYNQYLSLSENKKNKVYLTSYKISDNIIKLNIFNEQELSTHKNKITLFLYRWNFINNFIKKKNIDIIYIRYEHFSSPSFLKFLKNNKRKKIILEIPTYPYDGEYKNKGKLSKIKHLTDKIYRKKLYKYVHRIVTFSGDKKIWDIPCINISNGINLNEIKKIEKIEQEKNIIRFTSVSSCDFWHGIDRLLLSLDEYGKLKDKKDIQFNIVGEGSESNKLKEIVSKSEYLSKVVVFQGFKSGKDLDEIYDKTDIGIGSLGIHRIGLTEVQPLKNREYAAKGIPFIISFVDPEFRDSNYVYKEEASDDIFRIDKLIEWYENNNFEVETLREDSKRFTWDIQMKKVLDKI